MRVDIFVSWVLAKVHLQAAELLGRLGGSAATRAVEVLMRSVQVGIGILSDPETALHWVQIGTK
jgi:hypothetical protein